jgi:hypothetical protein
MNIRNYYTKAAMLVISIGFITALQSCSKDKGLIPGGSKEDTNLYGAWKRTIHRVAKGDSLQTISFYEGFVSKLRTDVYATPLSTSITSSTYYRGIFDTNGSSLIFRLTQKQTSSDINSSTTPVSITLINTSPYKISANLDTLTISADTTFTYIKVAE